jgi:ectoine hydroxylase-related dioxygenase (phytanoyl-CoA dioxygenase family)
MSELHASQEPTTVTQVAGELNRDPDLFSDYGYVVIPNAIPRSELGLLNSSLDRLPSKTIKQTRKLINERALLADERFFEVITQAALLDLIQDALGDDFQLLDFGAMEDPPGTGMKRSWHSDYHASFPIVEQPPLMVTMLIYLADMTDLRGPLFVKPGTHRLLRHPTPEEREVSLEGEVKVSVPGGTAIAFHSNLWHSGSTNRTDEPRRLLFSLWGHYWMKRLDEFYRTPLPGYITTSTDPTIRQVFGLATAAPSVHGNDYNAIAYGG